MIIILEGPDCAGKTTLAEKFKKELGINAKYIHLNSEAVESDYTCVLDPNKHVGTKHRIIDRHWPSEVVYGHVFRNGPRINVDRIVSYAQTQKAIYILCLPPKKEVSKNFHKRIEKEQYNTVSKVYDFYKTLISTYSEFIKYDYTKDTFEEIFKKVKAKDHVN